MVRKIIAVICLTAVLWAGMLFVGNKFGLGYALAESNISNDFDDFESSLQKVQELKKRAEQGDAILQSILGDMYLQGTWPGVEKNYVESFKWHTLAAEQSNPHSQFTLGDIHLHGKGVPKDYVMAYMWYNIAASSGYEIAKSLRDAVEKDMTPDQIAEGQRLSRAWLEKHKQP